MRDLERKKLEVERMKVSAAKAEMEYKILERLQDIERIKENMSKQDDRINEINEILKGVDNG